MPDTLRRFAMKGGLTDRHMAPADDGDYVKWADHVAHIDALTAAAQWLVDNSTPQHTPECWLSVDEGQECICGVSEKYIDVLAILEPHDA